MKTNNIFCSKFPIVWHVAHAANVDGILRNGFMSTTRILELGQMKSNVYRNENSLVQTGEYGEIKIRDQKPMPPNALAHCLTQGLTPEKWYEILNSKIFFWVSEKKALTFQNAYSKDNQPQVVLGFCTQSILRDYENIAFLTPINTGATNGYGKRGIQTFHPITSWIKNGFTDQPQRKSYIPREFVLETPHVNLNHALKIRHD